jgi:hypothetical protein
MIIGLTGKAKAGKDTVRGILERHGLVGLAFADPIRKMLKTLLLEVEASSEYLHSQTLKELPIPGLDASYRELGQTLGTEWGRQHFPGIWVRVAEARMLAIQIDTFATVDFVISDVRFQDEADWIRSKGGVIWKVERNVEAVREHISEAGADSIVPDAVIDNNGSLEALQLQVHRLVAHVEKINEVLKGGAT